MKGIFMRKSLLLLGLLPCALHAQQTELNAEFFKPSPGHGVFGVQEASLIPHLKLALEAFFNFAQNPVIAENQDTGEVEAEVVSVQTALDLMAAVGIRDVLELGFALPVALIQN